MPLNARYRELRLRAQINGDDPSRPESELEELYGDDEWWEKFHEGHRKISPRKT